MAILEAMAAGRPVVAVDLGGPAHLLRDGRGGRLVPADDPAALAAALDGVLGDPAAAAAMGRHNRRATETTLSWNAVLDELGRVYDRDVCGLAKRNSSWRRAGRICARSSSVRSKLA